MVKNLPSSAGVMAESLVGEPRAHMPRDNSACLLQGASPGTTTWTHHKQKKKNYKWSHI